MENTQTRQEAQQAAESNSAGAVVDFASLLSAEDVPPEIKKHLETVIDFVINPDAHKRLLDPQAPLTLDMAAFLKWVADKVPNGLRFQDPTSFQSENETEKPRVDTISEMIKVTQYFIARAMLVSGADHYRMLGLEIQTSSEEIQNNYRCLRRIFSPSEGMESAHVCIMRISDAYATLRNSHSRRLYNERLFGKQSNLYVSNTELGTGKSDSKIHDNQTKKATPRWAFYIGVLFLIMGLVGMVLWSLQPNMPLNSGADFIIPMEETTLTPDAPLSKPLIEVTKHAIPQVQSERIDEQQIESDNTKEKQKIQALLNKAERYLEASQLTKPRGDNAYELFKIVLNLEPDNIQASEGLERIAQRYAELSRFRMSNGLYDEAGDMIERGLRVLPDYPTLVSLNVEINALINSKVEEERLAEDNIAAIVELAQMSEAPDTSDITQTEITTPVAAIDEPPTQFDSEADPQTYYQDDQGLVSNQILEESIRKFVDSYEGGDIDRFLSLFAENARSNNRESREEIRNDYYALFTTTESRLMRLREIKWKRSAKEAIGDTDFGLTIFRKGDSHPKTFKGNLTFQFEIVGGRLLLTGLFHSQDRVNP